jgi:hypothetical protein
VKNNETSKSRTGKTGATDRSRNFGRLQQRKRVQKQKSQLKEQEPQLGEQEPQLGEQKPQLEEQKLQLNRSVPATTRRKVFN